MFLTKACVCPWAGCQVKTNRCGKIMLNLPLFYWFILWSNVSLLNPTTISINRSLSHCSSASPSIPLSPLILVKPLNIRVDLPLKLDLECYEKIQEGEKMKEHLKLVPFSPWGLLWDYGANSGRQTKAGKENYNCQPSLPILHCC